MELVFTVESRIDFDGKVSDEGEIEVAVEGNVGNVKRTIGDFALDYQLGGIEFFLYSIV